MKKRIIESLKTAFLAGLIVGITTFMLIVLILAPLTLVFEDLTVTIAIVGPAIVAWILFVMTAIIGFWAELLN